MSNSPALALEPRIELTIPAQSDWVRVARLTVAGVAARLHFSFDAVEDIKVAVSEAINNAIQHGPDEDDLPRICIAMEPTSDGLWITVTDEGRVENELSVGAATRHRIGEELPEGGMGFLLIRSLMDQVEHESGPDADTSIRMFKALANPFLGLGATPRV